MTLARPLPPIHADQGSTAIGPRRFSYVWRFCPCCGAALLGCKHAWVTDEGHWLLAVPCELLGSWSDRTEVGEEVSL
jgi:hypothetical protein